MWNRLYRFFGQDIPLIQDLQPSNMLIRPEAYVIPEHSIINAPADESYVVATSLPLSVPLHEDFRQVRVKIKDRGMGNWTGDHWLELIQSPCLRAPEVIL